MNDDRIQLKILSEHLRKTGLESRTFTSAETALEHMCTCVETAENTPGDLPAIIITDIYMPGIDGWRFCRLLRSSEYVAFNHIPIIVVSATYDGDEPTRIAADLGVDAFIPSNVDGTKFIELVNAILKGKQVINRPHVLIVDDSTVIIGILRKAFEANGYSVDSALTVKQANFTFNKTDYDVAVIDYHLSDGTGDVLLDSFHVQRPDCVTIMMTADSNSKLALNWMKRGASAYLLKPFEPEYLIEICAKARRERLLIRGQDLLEIRTRELKESEIRYRTLFNKMLNAFALHEIICDEDGKPVDYRFLEVNPVFELMTGLKREDIVGRTVLEVLPHTERHWIESYGKVALTGESAFFNHHSVDLKKHFEVIAFRPAPYQFACIFADITERKETENELRESEEYHKRLFDNSPIALYIQDFSEVADRIEHLRNSGVKDLKNYLNKNKDEVKYLASCIKITKANKTALSLLKANSSEELLNSFEQLILPEECQYLIDHIVDFTTGNDRYEGTARIYDLHKNTLNIILRKSVVNRKKNGLSKVLVSVVDVSELYKAVYQKNEIEKKLQQAQKMEAIGTLAGGIAHDFNNILSPIMGHTELLVYDIPEESPLRDSLNEIKAASMRAKDLVRQILTFSRQQDSEFVLMKIQYVVKEVLKLLRSTIPSTIEIKHSIRNECGLIKADPTQIHQIVMNLATNAYHAMEETGGTMTVALKEVELDEHESLSLDIKQGTYACLTVSDTGTGIPEDVKEKIFDPFFTTKEKGKGTGVGLAVVHGIVKSSGGAICVNSEPGKGTEFNIYLPVVESYLKKDDALKVKMLIQGGTERVLLVDDEDSLIKLQEGMLKRLGYQVTSRTSSIEALEAFRASPYKFDLIITDMAMPNMSGDKLAVELIKIRPDIPVLLCTGFSTIISEEKALAMGIKGFLMKPVTISDLDRKIRDVLDIYKVSLSEV
ncbi:MAG: response regulator [Desulfamplus sp.]|nr:response regulator [Desulfamplus sp.]